MVRNLIIKLVITERVSKIVYLNGFLRKIKINVEYP